MKSIILIGTACAAVLGAAIVSNRIVAESSDAPPPESPKFYATRVTDILNDNCLSCHDDTAKGNLRLDSFAALLRGGKDDVAVKPGDSALSPLLERARLPAGDDDHMPPDGKPQLTAPEIALLKWWIDAGAPETNTLGQLRPPPEILAALSAR